MGRMVCGGDGQRLRLIESPLGQIRRPDDLPKIKLTDLLGREVCP